MSPSVSHPDFSVYRVDLNAFLVLVLICTRDCSRHFYLFVCAFDLSFLGLGLYVLFFTVFGSRLYSFHGGIFFAK